MSKSYLLPWNPKKSSFTDERLADSLTGKEEGLTNWSLGQRKVAPEVGSTVFLVRVGARNGVKVTGIVGMGKVTGESYWAEDWRETGEDVIYFPIRFDFLIDAITEPARVLSTEQLENSGLAHTNWRHLQGSVFELKDPSDAEKILVLLDQELEPFDPIDLAWSEGNRKKLSEHYRTERSATLVRKKKEQLLRRTGRLACEICGFDFATIYGKRLEGFIEAHHLVPLGELKERSRSTLSDLILVCANCHRALHHKISVKKLRRLVGEWSRTK
jgi:5-methylcytosine-specific restriction protein A